MPMTIDSRRRAASTLQHEHPGAVLLDVTSRGEEPWVQFSPFYPHGGIPVPFTPGVTSQSVEGIWQALKVFASADVDPSKLTVSTMRGIKRTVRSNGQICGHREGLQGDRLLPYIEARHRIYLPSYQWVLTHRLQSLVEKMRALAVERDVVLLDYTTNGDVDDVSAPLSHAALVKLYLDDAWPGGDRHVPR